VQTTADRDGQRGRRHPLSGTKETWALSPARKSLGARQLVRQDGWQAAIFGGRKRPSLLMVAHQLASASEVTSLVERNSFRFSVPLVPFERANRSAGKKRNEFHSTAPRPRVLGKSQSWLMVAHQLASAYEKPGHPAPRGWASPRAGNDRTRWDSGQR